MSRTNALKLLKPVLHLFSNFTSNSRLAISQNSRMHGKAHLREDFIGFIDVSSDVTADSLSSAILNVIQSTGTDVAFCHLQGYDGASAMSGHLNGVQAIIRKSYSLALLTHCANHYLNRVLSEACTLPIIRNSLGAITELMIFFNHSAQRSHLLEDTIDAIYAESTILCQNEANLFTSVKIGG